jgi:hypothetical protein
MLDQAMRSMVDLAKVLRAYHEELVGVGFTEDQALALTLAYQMRLLQGDA